MAPESKPPPGPGATLGEAPITSNADAGRIVVEAVHSIERQPLLDLRGAAKLSGVSRSTWVRWDMRELVPRSIRIGPRVVRWRTDELLAWIEAGCPTRGRWEALQAAGKRRGRRARSSTDGGLRGHGGTR